MHALLPAMTPLLRSFAPHFSRCVWKHLQVLCTRAILTPARRTVTATLRVIGVAHSPHFPLPHRMLYRDCWSSLPVSRVLLGLLVTAFAAGSRRLA